MTQPHRLCPHKDNEVQSALTAFTAAHKDPCFFDLKNQVSAKCKRCGADKHALPYALCQCDIVLQIDAHFFQNRIAFRNNILLKSCSRDIKIFLTEDQHLKLYGDLPSLPSFPSHLFIDISQRAVIRFGSQNRFQTKSIKLPKLKL